MAMLEIAIIALMAQGPSQQAVGSVGFEELVEGRNQAAVETIEADGEVDHDDLAGLLNLGIAKARMGEYDAARVLFSEVAQHEDRAELETADGEWVDSKRLARKALAMLDRGEFARYYAMSMR